MTLLMTALNQQHKIHTNSHIHIFSKYIGNNNKKGNRKREGGVQKQKQLQFYFDWLNNIVYSFFYI